MQRFIFTTKGLFKASECSSDRAFRWYFSNTGENLHLSEILRESSRTTQQETCSHAMSVIRFIYFTPSSLTLTSFRNDYVDICTCTGIFTEFSFLQNGDILLSSHNIQRRKWNSKMIEIMYKPTLYIYMCVCVYVGVCFALTTKGRIVLADAQKKKFSEPQEFAMHLSNRLK